MRNISFFLFESAKQKENVWFYYHVLKYLINPEMNRISNKMSQAILPNSKSSPAQMGGGGPNRKKLFRSGAVEQLERVQF